VQTLTEALANFDGISYAKGASVLKALVAYVGREEFFAGLRAYFAAYAWGNASLGDLLAKLEEASGKPLADWSKAWLETAGPNTLSARFELDDEGGFRAFSVVQTAPEAHPHLRPHRIAVGLYDRRDGSLVRTRQVEVEVTGALTPVPELAGVAQPDLVLLNDDDHTYALIEFDERSLATLEESIGDFAESLPRALSWSAAISMMFQARLAVSTYIRMLASGMAKETSISVLEFLHLQASTALRRFAAPDRIAAGKAQLAGVALDLLGAAEPGSDFQLAWAQLLAWSAATAEQADFISGLLSGGHAVEGLEVGTELRWLLVRRLAALGRIGDAEIAAELQLDSTDQGRNHAHAARAAIPDAEHKESAWQLLTGEELGPDAVRFLAGGFGQGEHAELLAPYAERYFADLPTLWEQRPEQMRALLAEVMFPYAAASESLIERIDAFRAEHECDSALTRVLVEARDSVRRILASRALEA
jgi:aminopeptidase N